MMKKTCRMPSDERLATPPEGSKRGLLAARTSRVPARICASAGAGIRARDPSYCSELYAPFGAAVLPTPLMLITRSAPLLSTATPDGNHPVGSAPANFQSCPCGRTMAMALLPPHAT